MIENKNRFIFLSVLLGIFFFIIFLRLNYLSFKKSEKKSDNQNKPLTLIRGMILDRNGNVLASNKIVSSVFSQPKQLNEKDLKEKIDELSKRLNISKEEIIKKLNPDKGFYWLAKKIPLELGNSIKALKMKGIAVINEYKRIYPHQTLASQILGFTGINNKGLEGIEYSHNDILFPDKKTNNKQKVIFGNNIELTIDLNMQKIAQKILQQGVKDFNAKSGSIIAVDSSNGDILCMANYPDYNNNHFRDYPTKAYRNVSITDSFEPGSIFKIFTASILLEENLINENETFHCNGKLKLFHREIKCPISHGNLNLKGILKKSCNVGIVKASLKIPRKIFYKYLKQFHFGIKTGIELSGESPGLIRPYRDLTTLSKATISFGYEIATTPLQLIMMASSITNGGILYHPRIIRKIISASGKIIQYNDQKIVDQTISQNTSKRLLNMLQSVLDKEGTGEQAYIKGLNISGKTSTVHIYNRKSGLYEEDEVITSFLGIVPQSSRKIVFLISIRQPSKMKSASQVAAPIFKKLMEEYLNSGSITSYFN